MKIARLATYHAAPRWLFLKIETDEGVSGWGEPVVEGRAHTVAAAVDELADYLVGKDPRLIEDHWTVMYRGGFYRGGAVHMSAIAGIDQALDQVAANPERERAFLARMHVAGKSRPATDSAGLRLYHPYRPVRLGRRLGAATAGQHQHRRQHR